VDRAPRDAPRPLTFAWNGGPGSNALLLQSRLTPSDAGRTTFRCYEGGHMMYEDRQARLDLARDIRRFYGERRAR